MMECTFPLKMGFDAMVSSRLDWGCSIETVDFCLVEKEGMGL